MNNVSRLLELDVFKVYTDKATENNEFKGAYVGDLLSMVMANSREDNCFITVQNNINSIAVSTLVEMPVIIFVHNLVPNEEMIKKANEENICLLSTKLDACSVVVLLKNNQML